MSLDRFKQDIAQISGVGAVERLNDEMLKVWFVGRPNDYSSKLAHYKDRHGIKQVSAPGGAETRTADGMPILYFAPADEAQ